MKKLTLRLPDELAAEVRELAHQANRSLNAEIRTVLEQHAWDMRKRKKERV